LRSDSGKPILRHDWKIIETKTQAARCAATALGELGFDVYLPEYRSDLVGGVRKTLNVFPNYIFIRLPRTLTDAQLHAVWTADDVRKLFNQVVPRSFVESLRAMEDSRGYLEIDRLEKWLPKQKVKFLPGQVVRGFRGMLDGLNAKFVEYVGTKSARVEVVMFGGIVVTPIVDVHGLVGV
jgi:transcription antitermination factor NusG